MHIAYIYIYIYTCVWAWVYGKGITWNHQIVKCPRAFRLRRLAQSVVPGLGLWHSTCKFSHEVALVKCPPAFRLHTLAKVSSPVLGSVVLLNLNIIILNIIVRNMILIIIILIISSSSSTLWYIILPLPHTVWGLKTLAGIMGEFFGENWLQFPKVFPKDFPKKPTNLASQDQIHIFFCGFGQRAVVLCELMRQRQDLGGWGLGWSCINGKIIYKTSWQQWKHEFYWDKKNSKNL